MERTVVLIKPDGVKRGLIGEIVARFERSGLKVTGMKMVWVDKEFSKKHYPVQRREWIKSIGERALADFTEYGIDPKDHLKSLDPRKVGAQMADWLVQMLSSGPVVAMVIEGHSAIKVVRKMVGHTFGEKAQPGTIRGDFQSAPGYLGFVVKSAAKNLVHASGNPEEAKFEINLWFKKNEIHEYKRVDEDLMFG